VEGARVKPVLDELLPVWHHAARYTIYVAAPPERALDAARRVSAAEMPSARLLMRLRGLRPTQAGPLTDAMVADGFARVGEDALVVIGRPWARRGSLRRVDDFVAFDEPGYAKIAFDFTAAREGSGTRLATETRVFLTDVAARRRFAAYWLVVRPFSGLVRRSWLAAAKRRAEGERAATG